MTSLYGIKSATTGQYLTNIVIFHSFADLLLIYIQLPHDGASSLFAVPTTDMYVIITLNTGCRYRNYYGWERPTDRLTLLNPQILSVETVSPLRP